MKKFFYSLLFIVCLFNQVQAGMFCSAKGFDNIRITFYGGVDYGPIGKKKLSGYLIYAFNGKPTKNVSFEGQAEAIKTHIGEIKKLWLNCDYGEKKCGLSLTQDYRFSNVKVPKYLGRFTLDNESYQIQCHHTLQLSNK